MVGNPRLLLLQAVRAKKGAIFHFGLVCSSWIAMCRYSSGRRFLCPHGDTSLWWVENGNRMVARLLRCILYLLDCIYNGIYTVV